MAITSTGIGSGLDIESIITKLMTVERQPLTALQRKEASYQSKLSAYGTLQGALSSFQTAVKGLSNASTYQGATASVSDYTIATATASSSAVAGNYSLEVSKLAQAQKLVAAGQLSDSAAIGNGTISIDFGTISGGSFNSTTGKYADASFASSGAGIKTITISEENNSLAGIRDAINNANIGVSAAIVNDGSGTPYRLTLSSNSYGNTNSLKISVSGDAALSSLLDNNPAGTQNLSETAAAQNAEFKVNGIAVSKSSNAVSDVIAGVTLNLSKVTTSATTVSIARDTASVTSAVNNFVLAYNNITQTLKNAMAYNSETKTAAILNGEGSVRSIQTQLRNLLNSPISGGASIYTTLSQIGVSMQKDGTLAVDNGKLQSALSTNFSDFAGLFTAAGKTSDSLISYSSSSANSKAGAYGVNITQLASMGKAIASGVAGTTIDGSNNTLTVLLDGNTATITLAEGSYTAETLATEIQSKINGNSVFSLAGSSAKVTQSGGVLSLVSNRYGSASNVSITGGSGQDNLGLGASATIEAGRDVAGTINGVLASGSGQTLTGATGDNSEGIKITITGGVLGARGVVSYSQGYAYQFDKLLDNMLGENGSIAARTDGLSAVIKRLEADQSRISDRLVAIEKRHRAQFTALDIMMSSMSTTSSFLTQQISALQNLNKQSNS